MYFTALPGQIDLFLAFREAMPARLGGLVETMRAAYTLYIVRALPVVFRDGRPAGIALRISSLLQFLIDRDTLIEHEAFALPPGFFRRHFLKIFQDAALEVIDVLETLRFQISR